MLDSVWNMQEGCKKRISFISLFDLFIKKKVQTENEMSCSVVKDKESLNAKKPVTLWLAIAIQC